MKNYKWGTQSFNDGPINVVLFVSRNKDNKNVVGFKERHESFITHCPVDSEILINKFNAFVQTGLVGESCRMYYSVNDRNGDAIYKNLVHFLIDNSEFNLCDLAPKLAGIAATKECAKTKRWMFDFDINDINKANEFKNDILAIDPTVEVTIRKTPHGYAIITSHGFDTRTLYAKWDEKETNLMRDTLYCARWATKSGINDELISKKSILKTLEREVEMADDWKTAHEMYNYVKYEQPVEIPDESINCMMTEFGKCSYSETGCSDCEVKNKIRKALE
jgi:hypothetical protein